MERKKTLYTFKVQSRAHYCGLTLRLLKKLVQKWVDPLPAQPMVHHVKIHWESRSTSYQTATRWRPPSKVALDRHSLGVWLARDKWMFTWQAHPSPTQFASWKTKTKCKSIQVHGAQFVKPAKYMRLYSVFTFLHGREIKLITLISISPCFDGALGKMGSTRVWNDLKGKGI